jgi:AcrR family transcriptional regulator
MPAQRRRPARRRSQEERRGHAEKAMLDAAARLFARRGVDQTSMADIGEEAGYSRGLANHHFRSRVALVERLARRTQCDFVASLGDIGGQELEALVALAEAYLVALSRHPGQARAFFVLWGAALAEQAVLRPVFLVDDARFRDVVETLVRVGQRNETVRPEVDPAGVAVALVGLLRGIGAQFLVAPEQVDLVVARGTCAQFLRHTLAPDPLGRSHESKV